MKKRLSVIIVIVLIASILSSCNGGKGGTSSNGSANSIADPGKKLEDYTDVMKITGYLEGNSKLGNNQLQHQWLLDNLKIDFEGSWPTGESMQTKLSLMVATGEMPDVIVANSGMRSILQTFADSDLLLPIDNYLNIMPDYMSFVNKDTLDYFRDPDSSKLFMLPGFVKTKERLDDSVGDNVVTAIRDDMFKITNMEAPVTFDEFYRFLKAIRDNVPKNDPKYKDFVPFNMTNFYDFLFYVGFGGSPTRYVIDDANKTLYESFMSKGWEDAYVFLSKLYREQLIDKSCLTDTSEDRLEKAKQGKYGVYFGSIADFGDNIEGALLRKKAPGKFVNFKMPRLKANSDNKWNNYNSLGATIAIVSKNVQDPERLMKYINWQNTKLGNTVSWWGAPSKDDGYWYIDQDKELTFNAPFIKALLDGTKNSDKCSPWCYWIAGPGVTKQSQVDISFKNSPGQREFHKIARANGFADIFNDITYDKFMYAEKGPIYKQKMNDFGTILEKWRTAIVVKSKSDDEARGMVKQMRDELMSAGLEMVGKENYEIYKKVNSK